MVKEKKTCCQVQSHMHMSLCSLSLTSLYMCRGLLSMMSRNHNRAYVAVWGSVVFLMALFWVHTMYCRTFINFLKGDGKNSNLPFFRFVFTTLTMQYKWHDNFVLWLGNIYGNMAKKNIQYTKYGNIQNDILLLTIKVHKKHFVKEIIRFCVAEFPRAITLLYSFDWTLRGLGFLQDDV